MISLFSEMQIAARNLRRNQSRTAVAILTVALGLVAYLLAGGFIEWIFENMRESTIRSQLGHMQIVKPGYFEKGIADPYNYLLDNDPDAEVAIQRTPHVSSIAKRLAFSGLASAGDLTVNFIAEGIEPMKEALISNQIHVRSGSNLDNNDDRQALLGEGLAKVLGVKPGDSLVLLVTAANGSPNAVELTVKGVFYTSSKEFDDSALRVPIAVAHRLIRVQQSTSWVILLDDTQFTIDVVRQLQRKLSVTKFEIIPWIELADFYQKTVVLFGKQLDVMKMIIAMIIILTISNTQTMTVLERTTEIGTILAIGLRQSDVLRSFVLEGTMIGILGGIVGIMIGWIAATLLSHIGIPMPPPPGMEVGFTAAIIFTWKLALDAFVIAFLTTVIASILPAWRASRMNVVDALRSNQ